MKKITLFLTFIGASLSAQSVFINEIHYDNIGTDVNEAIEIAGPAGTDLSTYSIVLYNGSNGTSYDTENLTGVITDQQDGFGTLSFGYPTNGLQNGAPDGIALYDGSTVVQFLSYEGSFTAVGGVADGMNSTDIGVAESNNTTATTESLQLSGTGATYSDFTWQSPSASTAGSINNGQTFDSTVLTNSEYSVLTNETTLYPNPATKGKVVLKTPLTSQVEVSIFSSLGTIVSTQKASNSKAVSTEGLAAGVYFVQLTVDGNTTTKRLVVQ